MTIGEAAELLSIGVLSSVRDKGTRSQADELEIQAQGLRTEDERFVDDAWLSAM